MNEIIVYELHLYFIRWRNSFLILFILAGDILLRQGVDTSFVLELGCTVRKREKVL